MSVRIAGLPGVALLLLLAAQPALVAAQSTPDPQAPASTEDRLRRLEQRQQQLEEELKKKDAEIQQLKGAPAQPGAGTAAPAAPAVPSSPPDAGGPGTAAAQDAASAITDAAPAPAPTSRVGTYTPQFGFTVVDGPQGDMNISLFTYVRYLNQKGLESTYTNYFGKTTPIQERQDVQLNKVQLRFLGWAFDPKFRYFLYAWSSNTSQGQGAQVVLGGNLNYTFNRYFTLSGGIAGLPAVRTLEGQFPNWLSVDNRLMADEFFRPGYTSGIWARGQITDNVRYQIMVGNNMSQLGVSSARLDNHFDTVATALVWEPTGDYGIGFGDFENHETLSSRLGTHFLHSTEDKESQPNTDQFENTQIRLSDGTIVFTPNIFGPGVMINTLQVLMEDVDFGLKYRGWSLEGEYYFRQLNQFSGPGTGTLPHIDNNGFSLWVSDMIVPRFMQLYVGGSRISGDYGNPWETRFGVNVFPYKNKVIRWNTQLIYVDRAAAGNATIPYPVGGKGFTFNTDLEMAL